MTNEQFFAALWTRSMQDAIDWQEAAEFEGRVAAKLADPLFFELAPNDVRMMLARLEVEEEMDNEP